MGFIQAVEISSLSFPLEKPFSNHVRFITHVNGIYIRISTSIGIIGHAFIYGLSIISHQDIIKHIENDLIPALFEMNNNIEDSNDLHSCWNRFWLLYKKNNISQEKLYALASIDIAVWDIFTKENNISLHQYLGGAKTQIPVYGTTGWLSLDKNELIDECKSYIDRGVLAFKVRIGHKDDYERIKSLRDAVGNEVILMLDANQRYSIGEAAKVAEMFSEFNIRWLEEPTNNLLKNIEGIKQCSSIPIALGENILSENDFEEICERRLADYLQPDVPRCGGITGFCRFAQIALKYNLPICNHLLYELSASLVAAYPNGFMLEHDNFLPPGMFVHDFPVRNGCIEPPSAPGTGVELTADALKKYSLDSCSFKTREKLRYKL